MEDIVNLINSIEEKPNITAEQLSSKILNLIPSYTNGTYDWQGYLGHHSLPISKNLKELLSGNVFNEQREFLGLSPYMRNLDENTTSFEADYSALREALRTEIHAEDSRGFSPANINTFKNIANYALTQLREDEVITAGQYFYLYNSLKNTREEFIDDFI